MSSGKKTFFTKELRQRSPSSPPKETASKHEILQNVCFICATASPAFWAVGPCGHPYCALCALRLRAIFKTRTCPMCKSEHEHVYVGGIMDALQYQQSMFEDNQGLGMYFEGGDAKRLVLAQSQLACTICKKQNFANKKDLQRHFEVAHKKLQCDLCVQHKPVFPFEQVLYDHQQAILQHQNAAKTGHPQCTVCQERFYSDDELTLHCRERHEQCFICSRNPQTARYFADYPHLQRHFDEAHFVCREAVCVEMRFVVFASELELKAHQRQVHLSQQKMQRSQQRLASRLQVPFGTDTTISNTNTNSSNGGRRQRQPITSDSISNASHNNANTNNNTNNTNTNTCRQDEVIDHSWFLFDPSSSQTFAQSMSHLLQLNKNFTKYLCECGRQAQLDPLRRQCRSFQSGQSSGRQLVSFLYTHQFDVPVVGQRLLELLPERLKQADLQRAVEEHEKIQAAFPSLPSSANSRSQSMVLQSRGQATTAISEAPIRGRILSGGSGGAGKAPRAATNPSRDPLALLGSLSLIGGSRQPAKATKAAPPPADFPALPSATSKPLQAKTMSEDDSDEVFTIGGHQPSAPSQGDPEATSSNNKKGKKQLLMRFGGFSNPYNDT